MRTSLSFTSDNPILFKQQLLQWAQQFREVIYLDSNDYSQSHSVFDCILAVDAFTSIKTDLHNAFEDLDTYQKITKDWLFGYLSYDLKNDTEDLKSSNYDGLHFPDLYFFQPKKIFLIKGNTIELQYLRLCDNEMNADYSEICNEIVKDSDSSSEIQIKQRISKEDYLDKVSEMLQHIQRGDIYEANFCIEFYAENAEIDPIAKFSKLNAISKPPFAAFFKNNKHFLLSASPERYLKKNGHTVISQPIKGTARRFEDLDEDQNSKEMLVNDPKERSENIMIVDLVRNDLSRTAQKGSVKVTELCAIYSFLQVHQMISTITSELDIQYSATELLKTTFPMGSMTGAPKISALKIIENLEETKRGLYSGAIGYFMPNGDFDFNVVIRSILYNSQNRYVSFSVGSAITSLAIPENEYQECLLKAKAMFTVLS